MYIFVAGFNSAIPASERPQIYALDCAASGVGPWNTYSSVTDKLQGRPRTRLEDMWDLIFLVMCEHHCLVFDAVWSGIYLILRRDLLPLSTGFWCWWQQVPRLFWQINWFTFQRRFLWEDNISMDLKEVWCDCEEYISNVAHVTV